LSVSVLNAFFNKLIRKPAPETSPGSVFSGPVMTQTVFLIAPQKIVYISCNPATQARDLELMKEQYEIKSVQPVDMFPHTWHVENIVVLEKVL